MGKNVGKKLIFLTLEFLGVFAGIWAFIYFFKRFSQKILSKILSGEGAMTTLLQQFSSAIKWAVIALFAVLIALVVRKIKAGWRMKDLGFKLHQSWGKDTWYGIVIFGLTYIITLPATIAVFPSKAKLAGDSFVNEMSTVVSPLYLIIPAALFITLSTFFCAFWEEVAWRGYLQNLFTRALTPATGFFVAFLFFSVGHHFSRPEWGWLDVFCCLIWGISLGLAFYATGSLWVVAVIHTLSNLFWDYPFYQYLTGATQTAYIFLGVLGAVLLVLCILGWRIIKSFFQKTGELFVRSGWKASFLGIFLGAVALCYSWGQSVLIRKVPRGTFLVILVIFSVVTILLSFFYRDQKEEETFIG